jgi:predicted kinase
MRNLYCTIGSPGSGKSSWIKENGLEPYSLSADSIRLMIQSPVWNVDGSFGISQKNDRLVWETLFKLLKSRCERGELSVIDATHSKASDWSKYKEFAEEYRYRLFGIDFRNVTIETCKERNRNRKPACKVVPENVIDNIYSRFKNQKPPAYITVVKPEDFLKTTEIKWLDFNKYKKCVIIGDLHSSYSVLKDYFDKNAFSEDSYYCFVGDLTDRNTESAEVLRFALTLFNRPNVTILQSNHGIWLSKWAFDKDDEIRSKEFLNSTMPQIIAGGLSKGDIRNLCRKEAQLLCFEFYGKKWIITHGGIPGIPNAFVPTIDFIKGVGGYEGMEDVAASWLKNTSDEYHQCFGHRNLNSLPIKVNERVFNLEGKVEFGGHLRILEIYPDKIVPVEIKNNVFRADLVSHTKKEEPTESKVAPSETQTELLEYISYLRSNKNVYENKFDDGISSFNFKRDVFYKNKYGQVRDLSRGFFINRNSGKIISRAYGKFFNLHEVSETKPEYLRENLKFPCSVYVKENGYLGLLGYDDVLKKLVFASKSTIEGDFARWFEELFYEKYNHHIGEITKMLAANNCCMAFEVVLPEKDPHIIECLEDKLILLDVFKRDLSGDKLSYEDLMKFSAQTGIYCKLLAQTLYNVVDFDNFLNTLPENDSTLEGVVVEDSSGFMFKVKFQFYKTWKFLRGIKDKVSKGHGFNLGSLRTPLENNFYGFCKTKTREELATKSIIQLRKEFYGQ